MLNKIFFQYQIVSRMLTILPRKSKSVRLLHFSHVPATDGSFAIKYRFSNALYYKIGDKKITGRTITVPQPEGVQHINMTVHGFFRKNDYILTIKENDAYLTRVLQNFPVPAATRETQEPYGHILAHTA